MGSSTRIILPIALLFAVIFGITFISNNTTTEPDQPKPVAVASKRVEALVFPIVNAEPNPASPQPAIRNMTLDWEVGVQGYFDFWFQNPNTETAEVFLQGKSCTCAGAKFTVVPAESTKKSLQLSALGSIGHPLQSLAMLPFSAGALAEPLLNQKNWQDMSMESENDRKQVPGAKGEPQLGIIRVTFSSKTPGERRRIVAKVMSVLPNSLPSPKELGVVSRVGTSLLAFHQFKGGPSAIELGTILPHESVTRDLYLLSFTRSEMALRVGWTGKEETNPCMNFTAPIQLKGDAFDEALRIIDNDQKLGPAKVRSIYKLSVTVRERIEEGTPKKIVSRLDIGPFEKLLTVSVDDATEYNSQRVPIRGSVRGEIGIVSSTEEDRIDFGKSVNSITGETRQVELRSTKAGLDAELLADLTVPSYLQVEMTLKDETAGVKTWNLKVRIPPGKLNGSLMRDGVIVIRLKDGSNQRIRIPVIGQAVEGSRQL